MAKPHLALLVDNQASVSDEVTSLRNGLFYRTHLQFSSVRTSELFSIEGMLTLLEGQRGSSSRTIPAKVESFPRPSLLSSRSALSLPCGNTNPERERGLHVELV
jgi:hypothetical protein